MKAIKHLWNSLEPPTNHIFYLKITHSLSKNILSSIKHDYLCTAPRLHDEQCALSQANGEFLVGGGRHYNDTDDENKNVSKMFPKCFTSPVS